MPFYLWSQTAANNATADPTAPFPEGMAPSAVNDGIRAEMAALAKYRDDIAGAILTGGVSTGYTLSSASGYDTLAHMHGQMIAFVPHVTNGTPTSLNVDGLTAKNIRSSPGVELPAGTLIQGTPYCATYNNTDNAWYLHGFYGNPFNIPVGGGVTYWGSPAPNSSFIFPVGQALSRTVYSTLFGIISTVYGAGDGSTTFNVPDLRGRVALIADDMGGAAAGRSSGFSLGVTGGAQGHSITTGEMPAHAHPNVLNDPGHFHVLNGGNGFTVGSTSVGSGPSSPGAAGPPAFISAQTDTKATGMTITNASQGSGSAISLIQPSIGGYFILRVI